MLRWLWPHTPYDENANCDIHKPRLKVSCTQRHTTLTQNNTSLVKWLPDLQFNNAHSTSNQPPMLVATCNCIKLFQATNLLHAQRLIKAEIKKLQDPTQIKKKGIYKTFVFVCCIISQSHVIPFNYYLIIHLVFTLIMKFYLRKFFHGDLSEYALISCVCLLSRYYSDTPWMVAERQLLEKLRVAINDFLFCQSFHG